MTRLTILSRGFFLVSILCLLVLYLWPTGDWMGGPLIGMFIYLPLLIINGVLLILCAVLDQGRRFIAVLQGIITLACVILLVYYIINHPQ